MAFIWTDKRQNDENIGRAATNLKQYSSARKHSVKKQAFGELKNVIHNQGAATPFKGTGNKWLGSENHVAATPLKTKSKLGLGVENQPLGFASTKNLCADVLRKQQMKQNFADAQKLLNKKLKSTKQPSPAPVTVRPSNAVKVANTTKVPIYEDFDLPVSTCTGECTKPLEEIWGRMNMIDEDFLNKVVMGGDPDSDGEDEDKYQLKWSDNDNSEDLYMPKDVIDSNPLYNMPDEIPMEKIPDCFFDTTFDDVFNETFTETCF